MARGKVLHEHAISRISLFQAQLTARIAVLPELAQDMLDSLISDQEEPVTGKMPRSEGPEGIEQSHHMRQDLG